MNTVYISGSGTSRNLSFRISNLDAGYGTYTYKDWATTRKKNKIANLLSEMKREGLIINKGKDNPPCWVKNV